MARPRGSRNAGYEQRREALAEAVYRALIDPARAGTPSMRELAQACQVSVPTLKHYFGGWEGAIEAGLSVSLAAGRTHLARARDPGQMPLRPSLTGLLHAIWTGWRFGLDRLHQAGLSIGLNTRSLGQSYLDHILEPSLQAIEERLTVHQARGEMRDGGVRQPALSLVSPLLLALLHQQNLGGDTCRPLDINEFIRGHVDGFVRGYGQLAA